MSVVLLPVLQVILLVSLGAFLAGLFKLDDKTLSRLGLYVFNPALVFKSLYLLQVGYSDMLKLSLSYILFITLLLLIALLLGKLWIPDPKIRSAFNLCTTLPNLGTMGIPMVIFAFGESAGGPAAVVFTLGSIYINTVGVYLAANGSRRSLADSLKIVFKMPSLYGAILGLALNYYKLQLPNMLLTPIYTLSGAAIPVLLILLGVQLSKVKKVKNFKLILLGSSVRLLFSPVLAAVIAFYLISLPDILTKVLILQLSMPTAVNATLLSAEFNADMEVTAGITLFSTIASVFSIFILLTLIT